MIAAIEITSELVPYIILAVATIFAFGYFIGYKLGRIDGETRPDFGREEGAKDDNA